LTVFILDSFISAKLFTVKSSKKGHPIHRKKNWAVKLKTGAGGTLLGRIKPRSGTVKGEGR
jgi:hypothetical protein